jgi:His-Xaa-Ser system radical SAM maturase HxsB
MSSLDERNLTLLPCQFKRLADGRVLLTNLAGEYAVLSSTDFSRLVEAKRPSDLGDLYFPLKGKQFVADKDLDLALELLAVKLRSRKEFLRDFTSLHMVVVTTRCCCDCDYCQASSVDPEAGGLDMAPRTAEKTVDLIFASPAPTIKIEFQGGEPTLNWPIIELIVNRAEKLNEKKKKNLGFVLCSNLVRAEKKWVLFCRAHQIAISTSLDGPQDLHDLHRKSRDGGSSHERFRQNLELYREILGHESCCALLTITKDHLPRLPEVIDHYRELGFNQVFLRSLNPYGSAVKNSGSLSYSAEDFVEAYCRALDYIIALNIDGVYFVENYARLLLQRILTPFSTGFVDLQSPAGAGVSGAVYDHNGEVYPADEGRMLARMGDKRFLMGNVFQHSHREIFNGALIRELVSSSCVETLPGCSDCLYQTYCGSDPVRYYVECKDITGRRPESEFCIKNKGILDYLFKKLLESDERTMDVFWSWLMGPVRGAKSS